MKLVTIICEGATEKRFVDQVLRPYVDSLRNDLALKAIDIVGASNLDKIIGYAVRFLKDPKAGFVTTFTDFSDISALLCNLPGCPSDKRQKLDFAKSHLKDAVLRRIKDEDSMRRFIPYFSFHQFETLVLSDTAMIVTHFQGQQHDLNYDQISTLALTEEDIELINSDNKPSYRIINATVTKGSGRSVYSKVIDGVEIVKKIGLETLRSKNPHFDAWVGQIVSV